MTPVFELRGVQDMLQVYEDRIAITPKGVLGFLNKGLKGTKEIPYRSIHAVQYREAGMIVSGYLQFSISGGIESKSGVLGATQDENTFMFINTANAEACEIKNYIDGRIEALHARPMTAPPPVAAPNLIDQIRELAGLRDSGALTDDEFVAAKAKLLG